MMLYVGCPSAAGGIGGRPKPGVPQIITALGRSRQGQPAFASVMSVTPSESADAVRPDEMSRADDADVAAPDGAVGVPMPLESAHPTNGSATTAVNTQANALQRRMLLSVLGRRARRSRCSPP